MLHDAGLDRSKRAFVRALVRTGDLTLAGREAGINAHAVIQQPAVKSAIWEYTQARLIAAAPVALNVLVEIMTDKTAPVAIRRLAASDVMERAGYTSRKAEGMNGDSTIALADMTPANLRELVGRLELEISERSAPVVGAVVDQSPADQTAKPLNVLD